MVEKISTPRGEGRSMTALTGLGYDVSVNGARPSNSVQFSANGPDWFGPLTPMQPAAPAAVAGRTWDFNPGWNLATQPRAYDPVSFHALRALVDSFDPVRLIIERRKDQLCRVPWTIRIRHDDPSKKRPLPTELSAAKRQRIADITHFFKYPDRQLPFRTWLRLLVEDLLVLDAPTLYCERNNAGGLIGLRVTDGALIKRVIDDWGRTPEAIVWDGSSPFVWNGQTIDRNNYHDRGFRVVPGAMVAHQLPMGMKVPSKVILPPAYQLVLKGLPAVNYTTADLIYKPMNFRSHRAYGYSPVEQILMTVSIAMRRAMSQLQYFTEGNQVDAIYGLPATWTPDQAMRFQDYWDSLYSGNTGNRRKMKFIPAGSNSAYQATKEPPLKNEFDEWLTRIVCFAFSYPPAAFVSLSNRSIAEQGEKQAEEEGLGPLKEWASETFNEVILRMLGDEDIEFAWLEEQEVDQEKQALILGAYVDKGILTRNQAREKIGELKDENPAADKLMVTTATGVVTIDSNELDNKVAEAKAMAAAVPPPQPAASHATVNVKRGKAKSGKTKPAASPKDQ